jgi:hypothetical protein
MKGLYPMFIPGELIGLSCVLCAAMQPSHVLVRAECVCCPAAVLSRIAAIIDCIIAPLQQNKVTNILPT